MSHRVLEQWMGDQAETLEDLLRPQLPAVCVGINPAPASVGAGHYYQGKLGHTFFERLRRAGLVAPASGWEDDAAFASGIGFTDIVKRPTRSASDVTRKELAYGKELLVAKLEAVRPSLVLFTFKKTAEIIFGRFSGFGFVGRTLAGAEVMVMPGPYETRERVDATLTELRMWWREAATAPAGDALI